MFHTVIIPSVGRPWVLQGTIGSLLRQSVQPDEIILSVTCEEDTVPGNLEQSGLRVVIGPKGLPRQRNTAIASLDRRCDIVTFLDDDVELAEDYLEAVQRLMAQRPDVVLFSGHVVVDGRGTGGFSHEEAKGYLQRQQLRSDVFLEINRSYGCNINVRRAIVEQVRFDERLPLYAWLEDLDFARRCCRFGRVGSYKGCQMVHLGVQLNRLSGTRFGFSQIMNPYYLWKKGSIKSLWDVISIYWLPGVAANVSGLLKLDKHESLDRPGRLKGNVLAFWFICRNRIEPEHICTL